MQCSLADAAQGKKRKDACSCDTPLDNGGVEDFYQQLF